MPDTVKDIQTGAGERRRIMLSSGSNFFAPASALDALGVAVGSICTKETIQRLKQAEQVQTIRNKALEYLARRDHSTAEISRKLLRRGFDPNLIRAATMALRSRGVLDDERFAEAWIRSRISRHPEGAPRLKSGLQSRGVDRRIIDRAVGEIFDEELEHIALSKAVEKLLRKKGISKDDLIKALVNRGFSYRRVTLYLEKDN